ncbi:hypothetical protein E4U52_005959 [Claviceps spartinae]|nr:hypothetical protein E4U52_005959 [Claviceps spartinae]
MQRVKQHFPKTQVLQPEDAWAAIVKGAVLSKLPDQAAVTSTCATRHYGTKYWTHYDVSRDAGEKTYLNRAGEMMVDKIGWFIETGDTILCDQRFDIPLISNFDDIHCLGDLIRTYILWQCEDNHDLYVNLIMTYKSAVMTFSIEVDGEEMGSTEVDYA